MNELSKSEMLNVKGGEIVDRWFTEGEGWFVLFDDGTIQRDMDVDFD